MTRIATDGVVRNRPVRTEYPRVALGCPTGTAVVECGGMSTPRTVTCAKLHETLPALPYKPFNDALGQRIYDQISAKAWQEWIEHSKRLVNEYRLDLTTKKAHEVLKEQCEAFLFGDGGAAPAEYVPEKH
ncbi:MAG TPA: oxidative damage protection protein [Kofleriaceae bacterium]